MDIAYAFSAGSVQPWYTDCGIFDVPKSVYCLTEFLLTAAPAARSCRLAAEHRQRGGGSGRQDLQQDRRVAAGIDTGPAGAGVLAWRLCPVRLSGPLGRLWLPLRTARSSSSEPLKEALRTAPAAFLVRPLPLSAYNGHCACAFQQPCADDGGPGASSGRGAGVGARLVPTRPGWRLFGVILPRNCYINGRK